MYYANIRMEKYRDIQHICSLYVLHNMTARYRALLR